MRTTASCPQDDVLKEYLKNYFSEYGTQTQEDFLGLIPKNAIYHFLRAHVYGTRDLILPSELNMSPVVGVNGERFNLSTSELKDVRYCSNGVIYGMDKVFRTGGLHMPDRAAVPLPAVHLLRPGVQYERTCTSRRST